MKVKMGPYKNYIGPYQIAQKIFFWTENKYWYKDDSDQWPEWVEHFGDFLAYGKYPALGDEPKTLLYKLLLWIDARRKRSISIKIDNYDTWDLNTTMCMILHPSLIQLKETNHGCAQVEESDVPKEFHWSHLEPESEWNHSEEQFQQKLKAWDWVMDEMIFACWSEINDWESEYYRDSEYTTEETEDGYTRMIFPEKTVAEELLSLERAIIEKRISNGFRLMGLYWRSLWD